MKSDIKKTNVSGEKKFEMRTNAHNMTGHAGRDVMIEYIQNYLKWNKIKSDISDFIKNCEICRKYWTDKGDFQIFRTNLTDPFAKVGIDLIGPFSKCERKFQYIITATGHMTHWAEASALNQKGKKK